MFLKRISVINVLLLVVVVIVACPPGAGGSLLDDSKAIKVSGGEHHTLVVTANNQAWSCGPNGGYDYHSIGWYHGVLGTGETEPNFYETSLVRVHNGAMPVDSNWLEDIHDIDAGWVHSLALDVNGMVWSWGWNSQGQLGDGWTNEQLAPVQVKSGEQDPEDANSLLEYITSISAGRSGEHSLAVDANGYAYAWGRNTSGQCGNGGEAVSELTPVRVLAGDQDAADPNSPLQDIIAVSAGQGHSMGLESYDPCDPNWGRVYTWGNDTFGPWEQRGLLGTGGTGDSSEVRPVCVWAGEQDYNEPGQVNLKHIVAVSAGWDHSMAQYVNGYI